MDFLIKLVMLFMVVGAFFKCAGEDTKAGEVLQSPYAQCGGLSATLFSSTLPSCLYHCIATKLNIYQSDGTISKKMVKSMAKKFSNFSKKKMLINRGLKCVEGLRFLPQGKDCPVSKKAWNCLSSIYDDVCSGIKPKGDNPAAQAEPLTDFYDDDDI